MEGLTLIKHQLYARDCSKGFVYMNQLPLQGRYHHSLFSGEETEPRRVKKIVQGCTAGQGQAGILAPEAAFLTNMRYRPLFLVI